MGWTGESPKGEAMSKVEELHHQILDRIGKFAHGELQGYVSWLIIDDLISASHAEGVEEERERILASGRRIDRDECTDGFAECDEFVCPYSLIAPKEKP
jgi:hypothetical protein